MKFPLLFAVSIFGTASALVAAQAATPLDLPPLRPAHQQGKWGYINEDRLFVIPPAFERAGPFADGLAPVRVDGSYGYIDALGLIKIPAQFELASAFSEGLAAVKVAGLYGYINALGDRVIKEQFQWAGPFRQGLAAVQVDDKFGYIDRQGVVVVEPVYEYAAPFSEGLAAVESDGRKGFIDQTGRLVIEPKFAAAGSFHEGAAKVEVKGKFGFVKPDGGFLIDPQYGHAQEFLDGRAVVWRDGACGVVDARGKSVVPFTYDFIKIRGPREYEIAEGTYMTRMVASADGELKEQFTVDSDYLPVELQSKPQGAVVFRATLWEFEHEPKIERLLVDERRVPNRTTNVTAYLDRFEVYRLIFVLHKKREVRACIPGVDTRDPILVEF